MKANFKFARPVAAAFGLFALAGVMPVYAADVVQEEPPAPTPIAELPVASWAGPYAGLDIGYGFSSHSKASDIDTNVGTDGFLGGAFAGYNWQSDNFVYGAEADIGYSGVKGSDAGIHSKSGLEGSLRARLGYSVSPNILLYGTAGGAAQSLKISDGVSSDRNTMLGWTAGVGTDIKLTDNVFGRVEYRYTDFGHDDFDNVGRVHSTDNRVSFGVGMKF